MAYFPFSQRRDTFAFTCTHILDGEEEIRLITHHFDDGSYEFLCGKEGHEAAHAVIITIGELLDLDPTIALVSDLPVGCCAMRKDRHSPWEFSKLADEEWYPASQGRMP